MEIAGQILLEWPAEVLLASEQHQCLDISRNKINSVPLSLISYLKELKRINLAENDITYISGHVLDLLGKGTVDGKRTSPVKEKPRRDTARSQPPCRIQVRLAFC